MRASRKIDRPEQKLVSFLRSYAEPIPEHLKTVIYDTGYNKRGFTVTFEEGRLKKFG